VDIILSMKIILFDLGNTLEHKVQNKDFLMPGALELLSAVQDMRDHNGDAPALALVSDFDEPVEEYFALLGTLGIDTFFKPLTERVTLSSEVGVMKPDEKIFRAAIDKIHKDLSFQNVIFITEEPKHTTAARKLGMMSIRLKREEETDGEVNSLFQMIPLIQLFVLT
jgi:FMN phosphatase YigB (HAD superfamily)